MVAFIHLGVCGGTTFILWRSTFLAALLALVSLLRSAPITLIHLGVSRGGLVSPKGFSFIYIMTLPPIVFGMLGRMVLTHIGFAFVPFMALSMGRGVLAFYERFSLRDFISPGMGRWLMRVRRMLLSGR